MVDPELGRAAFAAAAEALSATPVKPRTATEQPTDRAGGPATSTAALAAAVPSPVTAVLSPPSSPVAATTAAPSAAPTAAASVVAPSAATLSASTPLGGEVAALEADAAPLGGGTSGDDDRAAVTDRRSDATAPATDDPAAVTVSSPTPTSTPIGHAPVAGPVATPNPVARPAGLGMIGTDRVDRVRQHTIGRPVQRLTVDIDDARVAVRVRGGRVSVDVVRDPDASLSRGWANDVERTLESAMRAQESTAPRTPVERDRMSVGSDAATRDRHGDRHREHGTDARGDDGRSGQERRREVPWWLTEEDQ